MSLQLTVHNTIYHGPLPALRTVAFATVDSQLQLPAALHRQLQTIARWRTDRAGSHDDGLAGWGHGSSFEAPAFDYQAADGTVVGWRGITGTIATDRAIESVVNEPDGTGLQSSEHEGSRAIRESAPHCTQRHAARVLTHCISATPISRWRGSNFRRPMARRWRCRASHSKAPPQPTDNTWMKSSELAMDMAFRAHSSRPPAWAMPCVLNICTVLLWQR